MKKIQESKSHKIAKYILAWGFILFTLLCVFGCVQGQKPAQTIINYTDNSQTIQVAGDGNNVTPTSEIVSQQTAEPIQTTEETQRDEMWKFWLIMALISAGALVYWYKKKRIL